MGLNVVRRIRVDLSTFYEELSSILYDVAI